MQSFATYFGLPEGTELGWAHAVQTPRWLELACADPQVHVLAATVSFEADDATPLLRPTPGTPAELDLPTFFTKAALAEKAVKLTFGNAAAVTPTVGLLRLLKPEIPLLLHADVFTLLSANAPTEALDPEQFVRLVARQLPSAAISLGWSLKRAHDADGRVEEALILQLAQLLTAKLGPCRYSLEIRAGYQPARDGKAGERGAALLLEPLDTHPDSTPATHVAPNVVDLLPRLRQVA